MPFLPRRPLALGLVFGMAAMIMTTPAQADFDINHFNRDFLDGKEFAPAVRPEKPYQPPQSGFEKFMNGARDGFRIRPDTACTETRLRVRPGPKEIGIGIRIPLHGGKPPRHC